MSNASTNPLETSTKSVNKGGRPRKVDLKALARNETQGFESAKEKWAYLSLHLADEAIRITKSQDEVAKRSLANLMTSAGIAFDKAWARQESAIVPAIPVTIAKVLVRALTQLGTNLAIATSMPDDGMQDVCPTNSSSKMLHTTNGGTGGQACAGAEGGEAGASSSADSPTGSNPNQNIKNIENMQHSRSVDGDDDRGHLYTQMVSGT